MTERVALYGHWICPFATRVWFALAERGIGYDVVDVPPSAVRGQDFVLPPEFVEHSPLLEIPMVRVGEDHLADSIPILEWLEERIPDASLLPEAAAERELVRTRMAWIDEHAFRPMVGVYYGVDPERIARASGLLGDALDEMGTWTEAGGWLAGGRPTLAEAVAIPIYVRLDQLRRLGFTRTTSPTTDAHMRRCRELAGWSAVAWTDEQGDEFVGRFEAHRRKRLNR